MDHLASLQSPGLDLEPRLLRNLLINGSWTTTLGVKASWTNDVSAVLSRENIRHRIYMDFIWTYIFWVT